MFLRFTKMMAIAAALSSFSWGATIATEGFETDLGGFQSSSLPTVVARSASGGNPNGQMVLRRDLGQSFFDLSATTNDSRFTGNYGASGIGGMTVDLNFGTDNFSAAYFRVRIDSSNNGWLFALTSNFSTGAWRTSAFTFDPTWDDTTARANGWITDQDLNPLASVSPSFASTMASVGLPEVRFTTTNASSLVGVDNFGLTAATPTPEPSAMVMLGAGLGLVALKFTRRRK